MIKTVICFICVGASIIILAPFGLIVFILNLLRLKKPAAFLMNLIARGWSMSMVKLAGCKVAVSGMENIPRDTGVCFVSNHGSIFDIVLLLAFSRRIIGFIAKKELLFIPFLNMWIIVLGGRFIDRNNVRKAIRTISAGVAHIKSGGCMLIFPEGHRSRGQGLLPFHPGSLKLATQANAVIIPVALAGTYDVFEKNLRIDKSARVKVIFGKPINTADIPVTDRKQILTDQIYGVIKAALDDSGS